MDQNQRMASPEKGCTLRTVSNQAYYASMKTDPVKWAKRKTQINSQRIGYCNICNRQYASIYAHNKTYKHVHALEQHEEQLFDEAEAERENEYNRVMGGDPMDGDSMDGDSMDDA
jgi:hypothetical protein